MIKQGRVITLSYPEYYVVTCLYSQFAKQSSRFRLIEYMGSDFTGYLAIYNLDR